MNGQTLALKLHLIMTSTKNMITTMLKTTSTTEKGMTWTTWVVVVVEGMKGVGVSLIFSFIHNFLSHSLFQAAITINSMTTTV